MSKTLTPKVLILGGGIQGTCLLQAFASEPDPLSTVLLETERIGSGQTRHSQAYIHAGFLYYQKSGFEMSVTIGEIEVSGLNISCY